MSVISGMIREEKRAMRNSAGSACSAVHVSVCERERGLVRNLISQSTQVEQCQTIGHPMTPPEAGSGTALSHRDG